MTRTNLAIQQIEDELAMHHEAIKTLTKHMKELKDLEKANGKLPSVRTDGGKKKTGDTQSASV